MICPSLILGCFDGFFNPVNRLAGDAGASMALAVAQ